MCASHSDAHSTDASSTDSLAASYQDVIRHPLDELSTHHIVAERAVSASKSEAVGPPMHPPFQHRGEGAASSSTLSHVEVPTGELAFGMSTDVGSRSAHAGGATPVGQEYLDEPTDGSAALAGGTQPPSETKPPCLAVDGSSEAPPEGTTKVSPSAHVEDAGQGASTDQPEGETHRSPSARDQAVVEGAKAAPQEGETISSPRVPDRVAAEGVFVAQFAGEAMQSPECAPAGASGATPGAQADSDGKSGQVSVQRARAFLQKLLFRRKVGPGPGA
mmetsp:Transcript_3711/g.12239  ORF Transcript_3711/g.12239 Transcript_3711/m.12239 type:complete len:275 (+) Transcript_3711:2-826(+)